MNENFLLKHYMIKLFTLFNKRISDQNFNNEIKVKG
jgi:hypothetical protein